MQTPAGYTHIDGRFYPPDWFQIVFSPSFPYRLAHTVTGFYVTTGVRRAGRGGLHDQARLFRDEGRVMMMTALSLLAVLVPLQIFIGDQHGLNTRQYQPAKLAAIEARWDTGSSVPLTLFAIPDQRRERNNYAIEVPYLGSLILTHSLDGAVRGLKDFPADQRPPVAIVFFAFRIMVGLAIVMLALVAVGWWLLPPSLFRQVWYLRVCQLAIPIGFIAVLAGWTTTEVGRQPWTRLWPAADSKFGDPLARRTRRPPVPAILHRRLSVDLSDGRSLHGQPRAQGARNGLDNSANRGGASRDAGAQATSFAAVRGGSMTKPAWQALSWGLLGSR